MWDGASSDCERLAVLSCVLLLLLLRLGAGHRRALSELHLEVFVVVVGDVQPGVAHLVDGAIAVADPLIRIRV